MNNRVIFHPLFLLVATLAFYEANLKFISVRRNSIRDVMLTNLSLDLQRADNLLHILINFCDSWTWKTLSAADLITKNTLLQEVNNIMDNILPVEQLLTFEKTVEDDFFLLRNL